MSMSEARYFTRNHRNAAVFLNYCLIFQNAVYLAQALPVRFLDEQRLNI